MPPTSLARLLRQDLSLLCLKSKVPHYPSSFHLQGEQDGDDHHVSLYASHLDDVEHHCLWTKARTQGRCRNSSSQSGSFEGSSRPPGGCWRWTGRARRSWWTRPASSCGCWPGWRGTRSAPGKIVLFSLVFVEDQVVMVVVKMAGDFDGFNGGWWRWRWW